MKNPFPLHDPENANSGGNNKPPVTPSVGGTGAAMSRSKDTAPNPQDFGNPEISGIGVRPSSLKALGPEEGLRVLSESWREDPVVAGPDTGQGEGSEYYDLRSFIWTQLVARLQDGDPKAM